MNDLVKRETAIEAAVEWLKTEDPCISAKSLIEALNEIPSIPEADVEEVRHGKWIELPPFKGIYTCSLCGQWGEYHWNYCSHCGAKMDLEEK